MDKQEHVIRHVWIHFTPTGNLIPEERKNIWSELEWNPGPLALCTQAIALTTPRAPAEIQD